MLKISGFCIFMVLAATGMFLNLTCNSAKASLTAIEITGTEAEGDFNFSAADSPRLAVNEAELAENKESEAPETLREAQMNTVSDAIPSLAIADEKAKEEPGSSDPGIELAHQLATREDYRSKAPELLSRINGIDLEALPFVVNDIYVVIAGHRARVVYDMVFENPGASELSGTIMLELPDGGSPCYLGMFQGRGLSGESATEAFGNRLPALGLNPVPLPLEKLTGTELNLSGRWPAQQGEIDWGELRTARVVNPVKGREIYEAVTRRKVDPALAEWAGGNKFSTRVYPLPAHSYKRIIFAYDRPLTSAVGQLLYVLPLPAESSAQTRIQVYSLDNHFRSTRIVSGDTELESYPTGTGSRWQFKPGEDFNGNLVFYGIPRREELQALSATDPEIEGQLVHLRYKPELPVTKQSRETGRAVFLLDTSYSSRAALSAASGKMLRAILEQDSSLTEFAVITFDVLTRPLQQTFLKNTAQNRSAVLKQVESIWLEGATNFDGLLTFLKEHPLYMGADSFFLLSDGQITWGNDNTRQFAEGFSSVLAKPWFCYSFGEDAVNRELFNLLARQGGQLINVGIGQEVVQAALAHRRVQISLDYIRLHTGEDLLVSGDPATLFPGQVLELAARLRPGEQELRFSVSLAGEVTDVQVPLENIPELNHIAARSWAELYVQKLLSLYDTTADAAALALSQHFSLTNREASFIILETDEEYEEHNLLPEMLDLAGILALSVSRLNERPYGALDISSFPPQIRTFLTALDKLGVVECYKLAPHDPIYLRLETVLSEPGGKPEKRSATELYRWSRALLAQNSQTPHARNRALRILSGILEDAPRDDIAARLVGYVLLEWQMYPAAAELFARIRQRRPFEPQNYLLEGLSLAFQGRLYEAAICYEIVLRETYERFDSFVKPVAALFYRDLLSILVATYPADPVAALCRERLAELRRSNFSRGQLVLFWNLDDTDVDLHVIEEDGYEVYYSEPTSPGGGMLHWDNTSGLGPELYSHPRLSQEGFEVFVDYFGSSSVEGVAPAATLVCVFDYFEGQATVKARCYATILAGTEEDRVEIMSTWKK